MTEAEKKEIVALVMSEISGQAVDFDLQTVTPQRTDILPAVRPDGAGGYTGVTLDWGGITDELTTQAKEFRNEALQAKKDTELLKGETNNIKSDVEDIYRQFNEAVDKTIESVRNVYQSDLNAESTARQTADNTLQQNIDSEASTRAEADTAIGARIDSEVTTRESEVAELERVNAIQKYEIENLKAKAEGKIYREEIIDGEAYTLDVPSSVSPYAEVQKVGGKSVVWNQLRQSYNIRTEYGITVSSNGDGTINIQGTATSTPAYNQFSITTNVNFKRDGRKYLITSNLDIPNGFGITGYPVQNTKNFIFSRSEGSDWKGSIYIKVTEGDVLNLSNLSINIIDLTQMFGSGNEPTLEECKKIFSADYYPYDAGTLKSFPVKNVKSLKSDGTEIGNIDVSSLTEGLKSAGSVHDEWSNGKVTKRVGFVNIEDLNFNRDGDKHWYTGGIPTHLGLYKSCISNKLSYGGYANQSLTDRTKWYLSSAGYFELFDDTAKSQQELKNNYAGTILYYELATPTETTVPEIAPFVQVEGGGSLTFESDDTIHMPVPSTTRFVVDLT